MTATSLELRSTKSPASREWTAGRARAFTHTRGRARRALNVAVAIAAIPFALPFMFVIALLIKLTSRGPALYTQTRIGIDRRRPGRGHGNTRRHVDYGGKPFTIIKFRTMYLGGTREAQTWARPGDSRITPLGRFLRSYRLDELPQLFNVIRGDMNIVGPRPEQPTIFLRLKDNIEGYRDRQRVLPGITGWAQVNQSYDRSMDDVRRKLQFDLEYLQRQSALEDLRIMLATLPVMTRGRLGW